MVASIGAISCPRSGGTGLYVSYVKLIDIMGAFASGAAAADALVAMDGSLAAQQEETAPLTKNPAPVASLMRRGSTGSGVLRPRRRPLSVPRLTGARVITAGSARSA